MPALRDAARVTPVVGLALAGLLGLEVARAATPGQVWTWGSNYYGQLGSNSRSPTGDPVPWPVYGLSGVIAIAGGSNYGLALKSEGTVWSWGANERGQLGRTSATPNSWQNPTPVQIGGLTGVVAIAAGYESALALRSDGTVWTWGNNQWGQLGKDESPGANPAPAPVPGLTGVAAISGGGMHCLALKGDGTVWAWGDNSYGQLGRGATSEKSSIPRPVTGLTSVAAIAAGNQHSLALKSDGTVWAWGDNLSGALGVSRAAYYPSPVQVEGLSGIGAIAAGAFHSLALKSDGSVWTWGANLAGQLGSTSYQFVYTASPVSGVNGMIAIAGGEKQSLALKADGVVWGWGDNEAGQLGNTKTTSFERRSPAPVNGISGATLIAAGAAHSLALSNASPPPPAINSGGVVDAASYRPALSPGSLASVFGSLLADDVQAAAGMPLPTTLLDTSVTVGGFAAPLFFVSPGQINLQVPFEAPIGNADVRVRRGNVAAASQQIVLQAASPAIFLVGQQPAGQAAILHADGGLVSATRPAQQGEILAVYCTGLGYVSGVASGLPSPATPVPAKPDAMIAEMPATVAWAGLAPGFVGLYQVNVEVPAEAPAGPSQPLKMVAASFASNIVTLPVVVRPPNPVPRIGLISVSRDRTGGIILTAVGEGFGSFSVVRLDGRDQATTFEPTTALKILLPAGAIEIGSHTVSVFNPPPGGGASNSVPVVLVYDLNGSWTGSWQNYSGAGGSLNLTLRTASPGLTSAGETYNGSLTVTGSNIVSDCSVYAFNAGATVSLNTLCAGYLGLTYSIQYSGNVSSASAVAGTWSVSAQGTVLDSGTFSANRAAP